jgi:elongation factor Ts
MISMDLIKELREKTSAGVMDCRKALEEANGNIEKAAEILRKKGIEKAEKKADRVTEQGLIEAYIHQTGKIGAMVEVLCETDFVARTEDFKSLCHELAMQVASMNPKDKEDLLKQEYIRDGSKTISDLIKETIAKLGENIVVKRIARIGIGE